MLRRAPWGVAHFPPNGLPDAVPTCRSPSECEQGNGVAGAFVHLSAANGVHLEPAAGLTDSSGQLTTNVTLGGMAGRYQITATTISKQQKSVALKIGEIALAKQQSSPSL